jgi:hypothetical protein
MRPLRKILTPIVLAAGLLGSPAASEVVLHLYGYQGESVDAVIDRGSEEANAACQRIVQGAGQTLSCAAAATSDEIRISGTVPQFGPGASATTGNSVSRVVSWGSVGLRSLNGAFRGSARIAQVPSEIPVTVTNISRLFQDAPNFSQDLSLWGMTTLNVIEAEDVFDGATSQSSDLSRWCLRKIPSMPVGFLGRSPARGPNIFALTSNMPRFGECGVSFRSEQPATATNGEPYLFSTVSEFWTNRPASARFEAIGLPAGLSIDPKTGVISGTPTTTGSFSVTVRYVGD